LKNVNIADVVARKNSWLSFLQLVKFVDCLQYDFGRDGDFDPFTENLLHTVFILYDSSSQSPAEKMASELVDGFLGRLGVVMSNV